MNPQIPGHLRNRLAGLHHDPHRASAEPQIEPSSCLWRSSLSSKSTPPRNRGKPTTTPVRSKAQPPDLLCRPFSVGAPDRASCSDITYVRTGEGWPCMAVVLDVGSRRLLGYAMSDRINVRLAADALDMAAAARAGRTAGNVFHSDRGSLYLADRLRRTVAGWGLAQSAGGVGSSADNTVTEAFFPRPQTRTRPPAPLPRPHHSAPVDLRMARPLQHPPTPHQPGLPNTRRTRNPLLSHRGNRTRPIHLTGQRGEVLVPFKPRERRHANVLTIAVECQRHFYGILSEHTWVTGNKKDSKT